MSISTAAARHLLVLCGLIPLSKLTQEEVDDLFRRLVEDAPCEGAEDPPAYLDGPSNEACG